MRFSLRKVFLSTTLVALVFGAYWAGYNSGDERGYRRGLDDEPASDIAVWVGEATFYLQPGESASLFESADDAHYAAVKRIRVECGEPTLDACLARIAAWWLGVDVPASHDGSPFLSIGTIVVSP